MTATKSRRKTRKRSTKRKPATSPPADQRLTESPIGDKLTDEVKLAVVQRLAMYDTPQDVATFVKDEYGIEISRQAAQYYDPTRGVKPPQKWCAIFDETRATFLKSTAEIPAANRSVRVRWLQRMVITAEKQRNVALAAQILEQIAKETGDVFTNKRNIGVSGELKGGVLAVPVPISAEEWGIIASAQQADLKLRAKGAAAQALGQRSTNGAHK